MTEPGHICAYYGEGPNYPERLKELRRRYPQARICAMVPLGYVVSNAEREWADEVAETELSHYSPLHAWACLRLLRLIRKKRFDYFVVAYDTLQLRLLAALSGAARCECLAPDNQIVRLSASPWRVLLGKVSAGLWGRLTYVLLWAEVYLRPVRRRRPSGPGAQSRG